MNAGDLVFIVEDGFLEWRSVSDLRRRGYFLRDDNSLETVKVPICVGDACLVITPDNAWPSVMTKSGKIGRVSHAWIGIF
jgi:hypothetical protein